MKAKFGSIITSGQGSLGGHTIQNSRGGIQLRNKPLSHRIPSAGQYAIRSIIPELQAGWRSLTNSQRNIWSVYAQVNRILNAHGDHMPLSGHSLWMKYQFFYALNKLAFITNPALFAPFTLGPELNTDPCFLHPTWWTCPAGWSVANGLAVKAGGTGVNTMYLTSPPNVMVLNAYYLVTLGIVSGVHYRVYITIVSYADNFPIGVSAQIVKAGSVTELFGLRQSVSLTVNYFSIKRMYFT